MVGRFLDRVWVRWAVGVALPVGMILLDPAVFHSRVFGVGMPILGAVKPFCYVATAMAVCAASLWLRRPQPSAFASGIFAGGALFATALGCAILPFSALGVLFLGLGLLGFTPFLMAAVYSRAAKAAFPRAAARGARVVTFALGVIVFLGVPAGVQAAASRALRRSLADIASSDAALAGRGVERLRRWSTVLDLELLIAAYRDETDPGRQARIAAAYGELTGQDAAQRAGKLAD
jgi:hypothetical protein